MTIDRMRKPCPPFDHSGGLRYRPEIDGIRALTVIPVVLFHEENTGFRGPPWRRCLLHDLGFLIGQPVVVRGSSLPVAAAALS